MRDVVRRAANQSWPMSNGMGNHRVIVSVSQPSSAAFVRVDWRRRDANPELIACRMVCLENDEEIGDIQPLHVEREYGEFVFRAPLKGKYALYYMPFTMEGVWYSPTVIYRSDKEYHPDSEWMTNRGHAEDVCAVEAIESRTPFECFGEMEVPASKAETEAILCASNETFLLFPDDREHIARMKWELPLRWVRRGTSDTFEGSPRKDEYYVFQIGLYARETMNIEVRFSNVSGISPDGLTCFNAGGCDWLHRAFQKDLRAEKGQVVPLVFGVDVSKDSKEISFDVEIRAADVMRPVHVRLHVSEEMAELRGDGELDKLSRLRWLNSDIGIDDDICEDFTPVSCEGNRFHCVGRTVTFSDVGLPARIQSHYSADGLRSDEEGKDILAAPIRFRFAEDASLCPSDLKLEIKGAGRCEVCGSGVGDGYTLRAVTQAEFDGHLDCCVTVAAEKETRLSDVRLEVPISTKMARYMVGFGREGGRAPDEYMYHWNEDTANNMVWYGRPDGGLQIKLKHTQDVWEIMNFHSCGLPESWYNQGKGQVEIRRNGEKTVLTATCGDRVLKAGDAFTWRFALLITPVRPIDWEKQWAQRYYHTDTWENPVPDLDAAKAGGATVVNLHQGGALNAYINYPFLKNGEIREQTDRAHELGLKYKIYYTVRELSNRAAELPALYALGDEILRMGPGFQIADHFSDQKSGMKNGGPWLCEHLTDGYVPAWQQILYDGDYDCAVATTGLSRWHNYYLEGLRWMIRQAGIDGLYLDGVGYDREIMKRVRKTMDRSKSGCLIDFHSGNNFEPQYGYGNPISQYMELMPYVDRLWLGEGYDYEKKDPDYWLIEISGIPFGLMGEMLQGGGNPWRGMLFGMSCRLGWQQGGDPRALWRFWDQFGIEKTRMLGWWNPECPVRTQYDDVKVTVYQGQKTLVSLASWNPQPVKATLIEKTPRNWYAPAIEGFQPERRFEKGEAIPVEPNRGWLLIAGE